MATYDIDSLPDEYEVGDIINCPYSGTIKSISLPTGEFQLRCWGAKGGDAYWASTYDPRKGGYGGYSVGNITNAATTLFYLVCGGVGTTSDSTKSIKAGGYNGGGNSGYCYGGGGGGATHISTISSLLADRSADYVSTVFIVAGGGGGGQNDSVAGYSSGRGGGTSGGDSVAYSSTYNARGGSQTAGGAAGGYSGYKGSDGTFGQGGNASTNTSTNNHSGGGGGGLYGGGGGGYRNSDDYYFYGTSGGGGGSGYVNTALLTNTSTTQESTSTNPDSTYNGYIQIIVVALTLPAPTNFRQTGKTTTSIDLAWDAVSGATGYTLYRDNTLIATQSTTTFTDTGLSSSTTYQYKVCAYNASQGGAFATLSAKTKLYFDVLTLITDRTQSDIDYVDELAEKGYSAMTVTEKAEWNSNLKGRYNASDFNRVGLAMEYIAEKLNEQGYTVTITAKTDWAEGGRPATADITTYLSNISTIRNAIGVASLPTPPTDMDLFTYTEANAIEEILVEIDAILDRLVGTFYAGEIYGGEV